MKKRSLTAQFKYIPSETLITEKRELIPWLKPIFKSTTFEPFPQLQAILKTRFILGIIDNIMHHIKLYKSNFHAYETINNFMTFFPQFESNNDRNLVLAKTYNLYLTHCLVVTHDILSHTIQTQLPVTFIEDVIKFLSHDLFTLSSNNSPPEIDYIAVLEYSETRGWHFHIMYFHLNYHHNEIRKDLLAKLLNHARSIFGKFTTPGHYHFNVEKIKSVGSMLSYLQKHPYHIYGSHHTVLQMFRHFDKCYIFPEDSVEAGYSKLRLKRTAEDAVEFFANRLKAGAVDMNTALNCAQAKQYLAISNLRGIFDNCYNFFIANRTIADLWDHFYNQYNELRDDERCICGMLDWLNLQDIPITSFMYDLSMWLCCKDQKQNAFVLIGGTNTGKSMFCNLLMELVPFGRRIAMDTHFTFANLIGADIGYWEEPYISADIVDLTKQVLEGLPQTVIPIKGQGVKTLNKRVPILISTNNNLDKYCSSETLALASRCYIFATRRNMATISYCEDNYYNNMESHSFNINGCKNMHLVTYRESFGESSDTEERENKRRRTSTSNRSTQNKRSSPTIPESQSVLDRPEACAPCLYRHKLRRHHVLSFIIHCIGLDLHRRPNIYTTFRECYLGTGNLTLWKDLFEPE